VEVKWGQMWSNDSILGDSPQMRCMGNHMDLETDLRRGVRGVRDDIILSEVIICVGFVQTWALSEVAECIICGFKGGTSRSFSGNLWRKVS
jgi:hypothetical protein